MHSSALSSLRAAGRRVAARVAVILVPLAACATTLPAQDAMPPSPAEVAALARKVRPSVFAVLARRAAEPSARGAGEAKRTLTRVGSGVAVDDAGGILTTASVALGARRLSVLTASGAEVEVVLAGVDPTSNVALLRAPGLRTAPIPPAPAGGARVGDWVLTLGASYRAKPTQTQGIIVRRHPDLRHVLLQITNRVYPGNSGAPALNAQGQLVGIVQGELGPELRQGRDTPDPRTQGAGLVLPIETFAPVVSDLRARGRVRHGFLGVQTRALSIESVSQRGEQVPLGALVEHVIDRSPAAGGGLKPGDLVVGFEGERVEYPDQLARWVASTPPGTVVELIWVRQETRRSARFALSEAPDLYLAGLDAPDSSSGALTERIQALEQELRRLGRELDHLKNKSGRR